MTEETPVRNSEGSAEPPADQRLDSWKEIAAYLKRDVRTVQRWEQTEGLPVRRHPHLKRGSVYAFKPELDAWWSDGHARLEALEAGEATRAEETSAQPAPRFPAWVPAPGVMDTLLRSAQRLVPRPPRRVEGRRLLGIGAAVLVVVTGVAFVLAGLGYGVYRFAAPRPGAISFDNAEVTRLTSTGRSNWAAISPDGRYVVHAVEEGGNGNLWVRQVAVLSDVQVTLTEEAAYSMLTFSPDGNHIYYVKRSLGESTGSLYQMPVLGGPSRKLAERVLSPVPSPPMAGRWRSSRPVGPYRINPLDL